jgi:hypothetical protein
MKFAARSALGLSLAYVVLGNALACSPPPAEVFASTEKRVRERYTLAESVELVTMVDVQPISKPDGRGNTLLKGERVTFRVDRIFKGRSKPGDKIIVESTSMCDYSVAGNAALKTVWSLEGGVIIPPRQWLFYRPADSRVVIGETDLARPINEVSFDLQLLERWHKQSSK